ncbi:SsrA-binding protein SmpB [Chitinivibrio alkaliphilus]|uniref:SsrA-binding protein n=1 Tax=Chitinivibrio alkaliphilus ACht1 TaxID=1313304 RepID=U7D794_9BACT|nr:SsrA-binding protein SmpB [Chitinivibrio alkaliphilus]ERP38805.1 SsrA-binding protein [Chitinivibrio alkaliphilus ACht1]
MAKKQKGVSTKSGITRISKNRKAYHEYEVLSTYEAGMVLTGTEVKALRAGKVNLSDGFVRIERGEAFLYNVHIGQYENSAVYAHSPERVRKLLLKKKELLYLFQQTNKQPLTLVALEIYIKKRWIKLKIGLCRGRKLYDKRQKIKEQESTRKIAALMKRG